MAITLGQIADILENRGQFDEALRIYTEEVLPVYERLGDEHAVAITERKINIIPRLVTTTVVAFEAKSAVGLRVLSAVPDS